MPAYKFDANGNFQLWTPIDPGYNPNNLFRNSLATYFLPSADEWYKAAFYDPATHSYFDFPDGSNTPPTAVASGTAPNTAVFDLPFEQGPADIMLAGGASPFGTVGQAGNVWEWDETELDLTNDDPQGLRGVRGFGWSLTITTANLSSSFRNDALPWRAIGDLGFRVASRDIPEPTSILLVAPGLFALAIRRTSRSGR